MSLVLDIFQPAKFLPVHVTNDGIELIETALEATKVNDTIFVEIGEDKSSTPDGIVLLLDENFPGVLESAFDGECESISFYI
jgi:hypothetical protein